MLSCVGTTAAQCEANQNTINVAGRIRTFKMGPTTCASPPCPLVFVFHGWTMSVNQMQSITQMDQHVSAGNNGGAIVVYPDDKQYCICTKL